MAQAKVVYAAMLLLSSVVLVYFVHDNSVLLNQLQFMSVLIPAQLDTTAPTTKLQTPPATISTQLDKDDQSTASENSTASKTPPSEKLVLFHSFPRRHLKPTSIFRGCDVSACALTTDVRLRQKADAVIFYPCDMDAEKDVEPPARHVGQVWIAYCGEPPHHYRGPVYSPAWRSVFNWTMTYRMDSDIPYPYGTVELLQDPPKSNFTHIAAMKTKNAAWFVSNCNRPESKRREYAEELSKFIDVDMYGRCGPLDCPKENQSQCINLLNSTYRYYLAFENSFCKDYVTEKIFDQFKGVHVIPVVRGGADYKKIFPDGTYINAADFKRPADLADHLKRLGSDLDAYSAMLRRKSRYRYKDMHPQAYCKLCELLHSPKEKTYSNFPKWLWDGMCWEPNDV